MRSSEEGREAFDFEPIGDLKGAKAFEVEAFFGAPSSCEEDSGKRREEIDDVRLSVTRNLQWNLKARLTLLTICRLNERE